MKVVAFSFGCAVALASCRNIDGRDVYFVVVLSNCWL